MITKINDCKIKHQPNIVLAYFVKACVIELFIYLFIATRVDHMSSTQIFFLEKQPGNASSAEANEASFDLPRFQPLWWPENQSLSFFKLKNSIIFNPFPKHYRNRDKPIYDLKKPPQKTKINLSSDLFFHEF
jgi:hypothetical protein